MESALPGAVGKGRMLNWPAGHWLDRSGLHRFLEELLPCQAAAELPASSQARLWPNEWVNWGRSIQEISTLRL